MTALTRPAPSALLRPAAVAALLAAMTLVASPTALADDGSYEVAFPDGRSAEGDHVHVVEAGEYLSSIAADYGLTAGGWSVLYDANPDIAVADLLHVGDEITIPSEGELLSSRSSRSGGSASSDSGGQGQAEPGPQPEAEPASAASDAAETGTWDRLAECESNGNWSIDTGNGYYGGLQFDKPSWEWAGGTRYAEYPHHASRSQQIDTAERLLEIHPAGWGAWPACSSKMGLR